MLNICLEKVARGLNFQSKLTGVRILVLRQKDKRKFVGLCVRRKATVKHIIKFIQIELIRKSVLIITRGGG